MIEKYFHEFFPDAKLVGADQVFGKSLYIWSDDLPQREESGIVDTSNPDYTVRKCQISIQSDEREGHIYERLTLIEAQKTTLFMNSCVVMAPVIRSGEWVICRVSGFRLPPLCLFG